MKLDDAYAYLYLEPFLFSNKISTKPFLGTNSKSLSSILKYCKRYSIFYLFISTSLGTSIDKLD